ncbi:MAG: hypothetical protein Q6L50_10060 [Gloeomargarita sp. GMQP_bins_120]
MQAELTSQDFQQQMLAELRGINGRLDRLENRMDKLEIEPNACLDGMVPMATTIVITAGAAVLFAPSSRNWRRPLPVSSRAPKAYGQPDNVLAQR